MYPVLIKLGNFAIYTYGFFLAVGFLTGILIAKKEAVRQSENPDRIIDLAFYIVIAAILGSRFFHVMTNPEPYLSAPLEIIKIWKGGLVFYGGFIGACAVAFIYIRWKRMPFLRTLDILAPSIAMGQFLGRIGCFFAGCCYGKACDLPWAVTFSHPDSLAPGGMPLHPTQLYHAFSNLIIFIVLWSLRGKSKFSGQIFWCYVFLYGVSRSVLEVFRADFRGPTFFNFLSVSQSIGITLAVVAVIMLVWLWKTSAGRSKAD